MEDQIIQNVVRKLEANKKAREELDKISGKELENLKAAAISIFSRAEGIVFARAFMKVCGLYKIEKNNNNLYEMGKERGKESLYLFFIKGLLPEDIVATIEKKIEKKIEKEKK